MNLLCSIIGTLKYSTPPPIVSIPTMAIMLPHFSLNKMTSRNGSGSIWATLQFREKLSISCVSTTMKKKFSWMLTISCLINLISISVHANSIMDSMDKSGMSLWLWDQELIELEDLTNYTENQFLSKFYLMLMSPMADLENSIK